MILAATRSSLLTPDARVDVSKSRDTGSSLIMSPPGIAWQGFNSTKYHSINFTINRAWGKPFDGLAFGPAVRPRQNNLRSWMFLDWLASEVMSRLKISSSSLVERKYKFPRTRHYLSIIVWQVDVYLGRLWEEGPRKWGKMSLPDCFQWDVHLVLKQIIHGSKSLVKARKFPFVPVIKLHSNNSSALSPIKTLRFETLLIIMSLKLHILRIRARSLLTLTRLYQQS